MVQMAWRVAILGDMMRHGIIGRGSTRRIKRMCGIPPTEIMCGIPHVFAACDV